MTEARDIITLRGLSAVGNHGVYDFERSGNQVFTADLTLTVDAQRAAETDDVEHTVNYAEIANAAVEILTGPPVYLLETLAHNLAQMALANPLVHEVAVTVHKPMAPVAHLFNDVSVTLVRRRTQAPTPADQSQVSAQVPPQLAQFVGETPAPAPPAKGSTRLVLALGSNQGNSPALLSAAVGSLIEAQGLEIDEVSPLVVSKPVLAPGQDAQPDYYNAIVLARTVLEPAQVLELTQSIETQFGRVRTEKWGPRTLDIDLIDYGGKHVSSPNLQLPHPRAAQRAFVLYPWLLADPTATLEGKEVGELAMRAPDFSGLKSVQENWLVEEMPWLDAEPEGNVSYSEAEPEPEPAPAPEVQQSAPSESAREVSVRGNSLKLPQMAGDSLFQRLLDNELRGAAPAVQPVEELPEDSEGERAADLVQDDVKAAPPPSASFPPRSTQPVFQPVAAEPVRRGRTDLPDLPSWRFIEGEGSVRIVDSVDAAGIADAGGSDLQGDPAQDAPPPVRRRVVRPSPTGMISLKGPVRGSHRAGEE